MSEIMIFEHSEKFFFFLPDLNIKLFSGIIIDIFKT